MDDSAQTTNSVVVPTLQPAPMQSVPAAPVQPVPAPVSQPEEAVKDVTAVQPVQGAQQDAVPDASTPTAQAPQITPPAQSTPVSVPGPGKELIHAPLAPVQEYVMPSEPEPTIHPELKEYGVEASSDAEDIRLSVSQQSVGIEPAKESVPVQTSPTGAVQFPLKGEEIVQIKKTRPVTESIRWLAELVLEELKKAYQQAGTKK